MALVKNTARNGAVCYHHDSKEIFVLLCLFLPQGPTLYTKIFLEERLFGLCDKALKCLARIDSMMARHRLHRLDAQSE